MPYEVKRYACSNCHRQFDNYKEALDHEQHCDRCKTCAHAYYVYGCEFDCEFKKECGYPSYRHWKASTK